MGTVTREETGNVISLLKQRLQEPGGDALAEALELPRKEQKFPTHSIENALVCLSGVCDGAIQKDGVGFNAYDTEIGHTLAAKVQRGEGLTPEERRGAYKLLKKYKRQLAEEFGIDYDEIPRPGRSTGHSAAGDETGGTQAQMLIKLAEPAELFHDPEQTPYATFPVGEHVETWPLRTKGFRRWLTRLFYEQEGKPPSSQALQDALAVLEAKAVYDGKEHFVYMRVAGGDGRIYLDLADEAWNVVEVTPEGWSVTNKPPVKFRRARGMLPLPRPVSGGSIKELRPFVNVPDDESWILLVSWLVAALRPIGPYPVLPLQGEQGSAKTTTARVLRGLVDPNSAPLRTVPRDERDLMIAANNGWAIAFDNLSGTPVWLSDAICRLATGGGFSTRELYTDNEEVLFDAMRPVILTGIDALVERHDLVDRSIVLTLPRIPDEKRRDEETFWREFEKARPRILGALLDAVVMGLQNINNVKLDKLPRMADFAKWIVACEPALPWPEGAFMAAYAGNRAEAIETALESDPVAAAIREFMDGRDEWTGTASELLKELNGRVDEKTQRLRVWPKTAKGLSSRLKRAITFLRAVGIELESYREGHERTRTIVLRIDPQKCVRMQNASAEAGKPHDSLSPARTQNADAKYDGSKNASADASALKCLRAKAADDADDADANLPTHSSSNDDDLIDEWEEGVV